MDYEAQQNAGPPPKETLYPELDQERLYAWSGENQSHITHDMIDPSLRSLDPHGNILIQTGHPNGQITDRQPPRPSKTKDSPACCLTSTPLSPGSKPENEGYSEYVFLDESENFYGFGDHPPNIRLNAAYVCRDEDEISDADSDYMNVQSDIAKFKDSVRKFHNEQRGEIDHESQCIVEGVHQNVLRGRGRGRGRGRARPGRGRGVSRGPRRAAEPTGDIKFRMSQASQAFIEERYDEAKDIVSEIIRINAETYEAWTLLASIWKELGDPDRTLMALMYAAHLRPKDVQVWLNAAQFAMEEMDGNREKLLRSAKFCYASAVRANPKEDVDARLGKAVVYRELGNPGSAIAEYKRVLERQPHDTAILRLMAETYIDKGDVETAKELYRKSVKFYRTADDVHQSFGWSDVNIYVELYGYLSQHAGAIKELKSLSRWLLGRQDDLYWDKVIDDDREWDADDSRRVQVLKFEANKYSPSQYGSGLPLELRVKLGLHRLRLGHHDEAIKHLLWLDPAKSTGDDKIVDYPDLYRQAADNLREANLYLEALIFYKALQERPGRTEPSIQLLMGECFLEIKDYKEAEECFQTTIQLDNDNIEARVRLAKLYEELDEQEQAFIYVNEVIALQKVKASKKRFSNLHVIENEPAGGSFMPPKASRKSYQKSRHIMDAAEREQDEEQRADRLREQYEILCLEHSGMCEGRNDATRAWMHAAKGLLDDFRGFKKFYPWDKYVQFLGYSGAMRSPVLTGVTSVDPDLEAMANRISSKLGGEADRVGRPLDIPEDYRGISFSAWLDIFLEYAFCLVRSGNCRQAYRICEAARDSVIWYHSREDMFLIHICWCACAVLANDEDTCVSTVRYFTKEYQFTTDSYRMFAALTRLCQSPISWYSSGPTQKYMLRQIKAMDYSLIADGSKERFMSEKGGYSAYDKSGQLVVNDDLDIALLMLYGHILYTGASYSYALNYFLRAYALDPDNPMINLSIGLGYVHYALKRQAENRQFHVLQGMAFLVRYYDSRHLSPRAEERQEAHYNMARTYHLLGLTHLALPYYSKVLQEARESGVSREDLVRDAVYNMQTLYSMGNNAELANIVAEEWLVL